MLQARTSLSSRRGRASSGRARSRRATNRRVAILISRISTFERRARATRRPLRETPGILILPGFYFRSSECGRADARAPLERRGSRYLLRVKSLSHERAFAKRAREAEIDDLRRELKALETRAATTLERHRAAVRAVGAASERDCASVARAYVGIGREV